MIRYPNAIRRYNENHIYEDLACIYRYSEKENPDGSTIQKLKNIPELSGLPCLLNIEKTDDPEPGHEINPVTLVYTLIISDLYQIKSGDYIRVRRHGIQYRFIAGEPVVYEIHQEVPLSMKEWA